MTEMHLAELNIGRLKHPLDDPRIAEFADNLERVNQLAERMPGFVWRLVGDGGDATGFRINDDPQTIVNLSVWQSAAALETFVFKTVHTSFYRKRGAWFDKMDKPHMVFWWVAEGHRPTLEEAVNRLQHLTTHGPTEFAFGWTEVINVEALRQQRCA